MPKSRSRLFCLLAGLTACLLLLPLAAPMPGGLAAEPPVKGDAKAGARVFVAKTCAVCHMVKGLPEAKGTIGPRLDGLMSRAGSLRRSMTALAYIKESIENPNAFLSPGYQPVMPQLMPTMTKAEYQNLLAYLQTLK